MGKVSNTQIRRINGFFYEPDIGIFRHLLGESWTIAGTGDLVELGAFHGRSAVLMGEYLRKDEELVVVDLFGAPASDHSNREEVAAQYKGLERALFEVNYRSVHQALPKIVVGPSSTVLEHVTPTSVRLMHVDASHLYQHVIEDISAAQRLLLPNGVLVLDDYRAEHTPGVAAASWRAVACAGLKPFLLTPQKMYATWGDADSWLNLARGLTIRQRWPLHEEFIGGHACVRVEAPYGHPARQFIPPGALPLLRRLRRVAAKP